jgi:DNA-binding transcriptional ArsR family regulator
MIAANPNISRIGSLVGEPARANMLALLMDGRAFTAGELTYAAGISPQTASGHLKKLVNAGLLSVWQSGRERYFRLASGEVGQMLETIMAVAALDPNNIARTNRDQTLRTARICYDHLAGRLGVALADKLSRRKFIHLSEGGEVTESGKDFLEEFGIDIAAVKHRRRAFCRACLDWTERRSHLAGAIGAALASRCFQLGWVKRLEDTRALLISSAGIDGFVEIFGLSREALVAAWPN